MAADLTDQETDSIAANGNAEAGQGVSESQSAHASLQESEIDTDEDDKEQGGEDDDEEEEEEEEEEEAEPNLKYTRLTANLASLYRNGDSTSSFMAAGDKMILGTHNGNVHVLSIPFVQSIRLYHAHSASITAISVSPFNTILPTTKSDHVVKPAAAMQGSPAKGTLSSVSVSTPTRSPRQTIVPPTPSNSIYIATASIDGHVCVSSLVDPKDVVLRNFARPVQAVALSPDYKNDRTYISGGLAGNLILTVGGQTGVSANANTNSAAAAASGWLGSIGLGSNNGRDTVLHSGEGSISNIKWSLSGKYVAWVNEQGIKIMRSNLHLDGSESDAAWKRFAHVAKPNRRIWDDMAGVWKARLEWIDDDHLESTSSVSPDEGSTAGVSTPTGNGRTLPIPDRLPPQPRRKKIEKLLVGWGDAIWTINVSSGASKGSRNGSKGSADIINFIRFEDCIVSGLTLYTPSLLLALVYRTRDDNDVPVASVPSEATHKGVHRRHNGLPPDLRLIDLDSPDKDEIEVEGLTVNRFETLSAGDYHLSTVYFPEFQEPTQTQRGTLEALGSGIWDVGVKSTTGIWDAGVKSTTGIWDVGVKSTRLFSSGASILSSTSGDKNVSSVGPPGTLRGSTAAIAAAAGRNQDAPPGLAKSGLKVFIQSPFDCVLAVKRDLSDRLTWLTEHGDYKESWELLEQRPDILSTAGGGTTDSRPSTPTSGRMQAKETLADFFADDTSSVSSITTNNRKQHNVAVEREKRRIGDLWVQQLVKAGEWQAAGEIAGKVIGDAGRWEHWIWAFAQNQKFDEISPFVPTHPLKPRIPMMVYDVVLGHYIVNNPPRLQELLDQWDQDLFDIPSVESAIESKLDVGDVTPMTTEGGVKGRDWHILLECLARLYVANARPTDALRCYIQTQNANAALELINDYQLLSTISDDIWNFVLLRITKEQLANSPMRDLESLSADPIHLLLTGAMQDIISPETVVSQLSPKRPTADPFLFFYFRALWLGETVGSSTKDDDLPTPNEQSSLRSSIRVNRTRRFDPRFMDADVTTTTRALLAPHADLCVDLFAEYSRSLLMELLKSSTSYTFEHASTVCETRRYIPELVHLLSITGQTRRALHLIIDEMEDVSRAIGFAREMDDGGLWEDLLDYGMDKPKFIRGLLEEGGGGGAVDPVTLVNRIPEGLEIEGLKGALAKLVRESEVQWSISAGAARVLSGEVAARMETLNGGRRRGVAFDVEHARARKGTKCAICGTSYMTVEAGESADYLLAFSCGHVHHLGCLLDALQESKPTLKSDIESLQKRLAADKVGETDAEAERGRVGAKMGRAQMISNVMGDMKCAVCVDATADSTKTYHE